MGLDAGLDYFAFACLFVPYCFYFLLKENQVMAIFL